MPHRDPEVPTTHARRPLLSSAALPPTEAVPVLDQSGARREVPTAAEHALTILVDGDELVTLMTIGGQPELLVLGYLRNQGLVESLDAVAAIEVDWERERAAVTTRSGRGVARTTTMEPSPLSTGVRLTADEVRETVALVPAHNAIYREAGSVHGCGLVRDGGMLHFFEDVGRHNATDALAGWMWLHGDDGDGALLYSTGRLTVEIVAKAAAMGLSVVISRNGVTERAVELAERLGVMLVARARRQNFQVFSGHQRLLGARS